jgi:hypothetical protein
LLDYFEDQLEEGWPVTMEEAGQKMNGSSSSTTGRS